jgi:iron(III) transport system substrate-binding protein
LQPIELGALAEMSVLRRLSAAAAVLVPLATLGAAGPLAAAELNLYNSRHYDTDEALYANFTRATGIKINRIEDSEDKLMERMRAEGRNSPADVLVTVDAGRLGRAVEMGLLQPAKSKALEEAIPANLRHPDGYWYGFSKRVRVIVYNKDRVKPSDLKSYEDLADPKWKGRIAIRSSTNVYNQSLTGALLAAHGEAKTEAWARGIVANMVRPPRGGDTDQIKAIAAGEGDVAVVNNYYYARLVRSAKPDEKAIADKVGIFFPNQGAQGPEGRGTHVNISGAGVAANAPNKDAAIKFLEYLATPEAQAIFAEGNNEFPAIKGAKLSPLLAQWGEFKEDKVDAALFAKNNAEALKIMDRAGWK